MPLSSSNLSMIGPTSSSLRPEYTTSEPSPETDSPPDADPPPEADPPPCEVVSPCEVDPLPDSSCPHPAAASTTITESVKTPRDLFHNRAKLLLPNAAPDLAGECFWRPSTRGY